jgi:outer membrane protein
MKSIAALVCALFLSTLALPAQGTNLKVALVDLQKCFNDYYKTEEAKARINDQGSGYQKEFNDRMEDYKKLVDQINGLRESAKDTSASESARKEREDKLREKIQEAQTRERELNEFRGTSSKLLQDLQVRQRKSIVDEINKVVENFSKGKYNLVIDKSGMTLNGTSGLVYTEGLTDITDEITKLLNKDKPAAGAKK